MSYELAFDSRALKEWQKLGHTVREQFKKKLSERLINPRVPAARLHGHTDRYKIKLRASGYRLVYQRKTAENPRPMRAGRKGGKARRALKILLRC